MSTRSALRGFTLIEMAIVMVIVALLISMAVALNRFVTVAGIHIA